MSLWEFTATPDHFQFVKKTEALQYLYKVSMEYGYDVFQVLDIKGMRLASVSSTNLKVEPNTTGLMYHTYKNLDVVLDTLKEVLIKCSNFMVEISQDNLHDLTKPLPKGLKSYKEIGGVWIKQVSSGVSLLVVKGNEPYNYAPTLTDMYEQIYDLNCFALVAELKWEP